MTGFEFALVVVVIVLSLWLAIRRSVAVGHRLEVETLRRQANERQGDLARWTIGNLAGHLQENMYEIGPEKWNIVNDMIEEVYDLD